TRRLRRHTCRVRSAPRRHRTAGGPGRRCMDGRSGRSRRPAEPALARRRRRVVSYAFRETYPNGGRVFRGDERRTGEKRNGTWQYRLPGPIPLVPGPLQLPLLQELAEVRDSLLQPLAELHLRLPAQHLAGAGNVGLAHLRIVHGKRSLLDAARRSRDLEYQLGELTNRELDRIADVR